MLRVIQLVPVIGLFAFVISPTLVQAQPMSEQIFSSGGVMGAISQAFGILILVLLSGVVCGIIYGASAGVAFCHNNGYLVYARRRDLVLWGVPAIFMSYAAGFLVAQLFPASLQEIVVIGVVLACVVGWWVLQYRIAKTTNPHADPQHLWKIYLARVGSASVMGVMVWALLPQGGSSRDRTLQQEINRVLFLLAIAAMGWMYANYVCYPDAEKYPNARSVEA